jgi:putative GTP pyrophosphokinase
MATKTPEEWGNDFHVHRPHVAAFTEEMRRLLEHLLDNAGIDAQIEYRTKKVESFVEKIRRKNEKYEEPLKEITDLCGLRIIGYYLEDVVEIGALLEREFAIDWGNSVRYRPDSDPERFGYRSDQYVVSLSSERESLPEWSRYSDDVAEIQVRTIMQHAWAAVDHKIRYKARDLPIEIVRRLYRLSAVLETADDQFSAVRRESEAVEAGYRKSIDAEDYDVALDVLSLRGFLQATGTTGTWAEKAVELGYLEGPAFEMWRTQPEQYFAQEDLRSPLHALEIAKRTTLAEVQELFNAAEQWGETVLRHILHASNQHGFVPYAVPKDILAFFALYDAGNLSAVKRLGYRDELILAIQDAIKAKKAGSST